MTGFYCMKVKYSDYNRSRYLHQKDRQTINNILRCLLKNLHQKGVNFYFPIIRVFNKMHSDAQTTLILVFIYCS